MNAVPFNIFLGECVYLEISKEIVIYLEASFQDFVDF